MTRFLCGIPMELDWICGLETSSQYLEPFNEIDDPEPSSSAPLIEK
jgi:hypothetical protein